MAQNRRKGDTKKGNSTRSLYIEPYSGISGNMILAALIDCGIDLREFNEKMAGIKTGEKWSISIREIRKSGRRAKHLDVSVRAKSHPHRTLPQIKKIINSAGTLPEGSRRKACAIFERLAAAEAAVHGAETASVHFHEVGAVDAIIDITGTCLALEMLGIQKVFSMPPPLGTGTTAGAHGIMPVPAPATLELMKGFPSEKSSIRAELTTPTGAAILTSITDEWSVSPGGILAAAGSGAGTYDLGEIPNILRASIFEAPSRGDDTVSVLECWMDDFSGEHFSWLGPLLLESGALEYAILPATMKKGRPGIVLQVLCPPSEAGKLSDIILAETSTLGIRTRTENRKILRREIRGVETPMGRVSAKFAYDSDGRLLKCKPESDSCISLAKSLKKSYYKTYKAIESHLRTRDS